MKKSYSFLSKTLAVFLCVALAMGLAYFLLGILYAYNFPDAPDMPYAFLHEQDLMMFGAALCGLGVLGCLTYLMRAVGRRPDEPGFFPGWQEKIPLDLYLTVIILLGMLVGALGVELSYTLERIDVTALMLMGLPIAAAAALLLVALLTTLAVRLKLGGWWKNTVCYWCLKLLLRVWRWFWGLCKRLWARIWVLLSGLPAIWPVAVCTGAFLLVAFILGGASIYSGFGTFLWFCVCAVVFLACCVGAIQFGAIKKVTDRLAAGELDAKVETGKLLPVFRRHAASINSIAAGMTAAVEKQLKSERFKTELITNVSHDLKTPLTSIINYVDLLGKEELGNEKAAGYIQVLSRQAQRLKKLTEDLIEASKASTGNIPVERARTDVAELLSQCSAEYTERMQAAGLSIVCDAQKGLCALADGRLLWRVFDNLLGNACKYGQSGTRVYLTAREANGRARIEIKNISRDVLNVSADELMERFVRGDSSRTAEGSGLGLSIARSLTELNGGALTLYVDGDLFKASVELELA